MLEIGRIYRNAKHEWLIAIDHDRVLTFVQGVERVRKAKVKKLTLLGDVTIDALTLKLGVESEVLDAAMRRLLLSNLPPQDRAKRERTKDRQPRSSAYTPRLHRVLGG